MDFLTKKKKVNNGEVPQYYVENSHPAIIAPEEFDAVQAEFQRRRSLGRRYSGQSVISARIVCGDCGDYYGSKVWHSNDPYRKVVWQCNSKFAHDHKCSTPTLDENDIKCRFLQVYNGFLQNRKSLLEDALLIQDTLTDCTELDTEMERIGAELEVITGLMRKCIEENASSTLDQQEYLQRYEGLVARHNAARERYETLAAQRESRQFKASQIGGFILELREREQPLVQFDDRLWLMTIDHVVANSDGSLTFQLYNGMELVG